jgi:multiple sugar transport system permease protein
MSGLAPAVTDPGVREADQRKARARLEGHPLLPYLLVLPGAVYLLLFQIYPLLQELILSFTATSLLSPAQHLWVGLENYRDLWRDPDFRGVILTTLVYTVVCVVSAIGLGLFAALLLDAPFRGRGIARAAITIPWAAPPVAVALIFVWVYNAQYGVLGRVLRFFGLAAGAENWLDSTTYALPAVLIATIWQIFPFAAVVILAALQGVPSELREAAVMDGADSLSVFKAVVWPTIKPSVTLLALFSTIWSLRRFDLIWLLTQGGPIGATNTLVIDLYRRAFVSQQLGQAAAVGMVGVTVAVAATLVYFRYSARAEKAGER